MSDHPEQSAGADLTAAGAGEGAGEGGSSSIPGHHPGALAAVASLAGLAGVGVKGVAGNWDPGNPEKDQSLLPNGRKLRLGTDSRNDYKSCVCDIELSATVIANTFETGAAPQADYETRILSSLQPGDGWQGIKNLDDLREAIADEERTLQAQIAQMHAGTRDSGPREYERLVWATFCRITANIPPDPPASLPQGEETR